MTLYLVLLACSALAVTIHVPGDQASIYTGLSAASSGDTVLVACGSYTESYLSVPAGVILRSETGNADCASIDGEGWNTLFEMTSPAPGAAIEGFTLINGVADGNPGGIYLYDSYLDIRNCAFVDCSPGLFLEGASSATLIGCTFFSCEGSLANGIVALDGSTVAAENSILAFGQYAAATHVDGTSSAVFSCSDIYGNEGGDWTGVIAGQLGTVGNISENPYFCDALAGELTLEEFSTCATSPDCGVIGAFPVACPTPNLLSNPGFEEQGAGWTWDGADAYPMESDPFGVQAYEGNWFALLLGQSSNLDSAYWWPADLRQTVSIVPGEDYVLQFQYQLLNTHVDDLNQTLAATITFIDVNQQEVGSTSFDIPHAEVWTTGGLALSAPASADSCTVSFSVLPNGGYDLEEIYLFLDSIFLSPLRPAMACGEASSILVAPAEPVDFTSCSWGQILGFHWDFGDEMTSLDENPTHSYLLPGNYDVSLIVHGAFASDTTSVATIEVLDNPPVACFAASDTLAAPPVTIDFTNCSSGFITGYEWEFGDGESATAENPSHYYELPGLYDVRLVAFGAVLSDTTHLTIEVLPPSATILSVLDVPGDQGRQVRLSWAASAFDVFDAPVSVTDYALYRRIDINPRNDDRWPPGTWDFLVEVPASGELDYNTVVPTLCDSTLIDGQCLSVFFIRALTVEPTQYYDSAPDSGYSVDNLLPSVPGNFLVDYDYPIGNTLNWDEISDEDFNYFRVYRGESADFAPSGENLVHETTGTSWTDAIGDHSHHYKVSSVDFAGNESGPVSPDEITNGPDGALPSSFALYQNSPNPFNPATSIRFDLPSAGDVRLEIFDVTGRRVAMLADGLQDAGRHELSWRGEDDRGRPLSSGVYFYKLSSAGFTETRQMLLLK